MSKFLKQAQHNEHFNKSLKDNFKEHYYDWKITSLFYIAIHYLKNLAEERGIDIGQIHEKIKLSVNPDKNNPAMRITRNAWYDYKQLLHYSRTSRYDGINTDVDVFEKIMKVDYGYCLLHLERFKKYIEDQKSKIIK